MQDVDRSNHRSSSIAIADGDAVLHELATLISDALNLGLTADQIDPDAPLYKEGLGLDSIDILEIAVVVAKRYDIQLKADSEENQLIFRSLRTLAGYVASHRQQRDS